MSWDGFEDDLGGSSSSQIDLSWVIIACLMAMVLALISMVSVTLAAQEQRVEEQRRQAETARQETQQAQQETQQAREERGKMGEQLLKRLNPDMLHDWFSYLPSTVSASEPNVVTIGGVRFEGAQYHLLRRIHWELYIGKLDQAPNWVPLTEFTGGGAAFGRHGPAKADGENYGDSYEALENMQFHGRTPTDQGVLSDLTQKVKLCLFYTVRGDQLLIAESPSSPTQTPVSRQQFEALVRNHKGLFIYLNNSPGVEDPQWVKDLWRSRGMRDLGSLQGMWR